MYYNKSVRQNTDTLQPCMQHSQYLQPFIASAPSFPAASPGMNVSQLPTGIPVGPSQSPMPSQQPVAQQIPQTTMPGFIPQTVESTLYVPGFLRTQIGRRVRVEFLIGTNGITDRSGILVGVGASYILLREPMEDNIIMADLYSIKFVTILM